MGEVLQLPTGERPGSPGQLLRLLRDGAAHSRPQLAEVSGASRSAVAQRVDDLLATGLVVEDGATASTGGRRAVRLRFDHTSGLVLTGDLGATHARVAVTDLAGGLLAELPADVDISSGPVAVLDWLGDRFDELLADLGRAADDVRGIGVGVPGPVEHSSGRPISPPIMPGWDGYPVVDHLRARIDVPVLVDNDVNIMALGEYWTHWRDRVDDLLFVKVGTGIGSGIVAGGLIQRGAQGAAGDLGHIRVPDHDGAVCRCGNVGCVEAVAGGKALADQLRRLGRDAPDARAVAALVAAGDREATRLVRDAGRSIGRVLAAAVNILNPRVIVVGGDVAAAHEQLLAGIREVVYQRSLPLATRDLRLLPSRLGDGAGVRGAAVMVVEHVLAPARVDELVAGVLAGDGGGRGHGRRAVAGGTGETTRRAGGTTTRTGGAGGTTSETARQS